MSQIMWRTESGRRIPLRFATMCQTGKEPLLSEGFAQARLEQMQSAGFEHRDGHAPTRYYKCPHCDFYHLTAQPLRRKR